MRVSEIAGVRTTRLGGQDSSCRVRSSEFSSDERIERQRIRKARQRFGGGTSSATTVELAEIDIRNALHLLRDPDGFAEERALAQIARGKAKGVEQERRGSQARRLPIHSRPGAAPPACITITLCLHVARTRPAGIDPPLLASED